MKELKIIIAQVDILLERVIARVDIQLEVRPPSIRYVPFSAKMIQRIPASETMFVRWFHLITALVLGVESAVPLVQGWSWLTRKPPAVSPRQPPAEILTCWGALRGCTFCITDDCNLPPKYHPVGCVCQGGAKTGPQPPWPILHARL